jgi:hypothetical protein
VIRLRAQEDSERALRELTADGTSTSVAIREALISAARARAQQRLRAEAIALAADPDDVAEMRRVQTDMEPLRAW